MTRPLVPVPGAAAHPTKDGWVQRAALGIQGAV